MNCAQYGTFKETFVFTLVVTCCSSSLPVVSQGIQTAQGSGFVFFLSGINKNSICVTDSGAYNHTCQVCYFTNERRKWLLFRQVIARLAVEAKVADEDVVSQP